MLRRYFWRLYYSFWRRLSLKAPRIATKLRYRMVTKKKCNLRDPTSLNEKMQWLKLNTYWNNPIVQQCADKYLVRDYVINHGFGDTLLELYGVWDDAKQIDWDDLPNKFVLKCNHGSGSIIICKDKSRLDKEQAIEKLNGWLMEDFGLERAEYSYVGIPKKVIAEELIETDDDLPPKDYKLFMSYGELKFLFVASERYEGNTKFDFFTPDWTWIPVKNQHPNALIPPRKPVQFNQMKIVAEELSADLPLVRVDLYNEMGKIIFGEMTFLHFGGVQPFDPEEYDEIFGELFDITRELK